MKKTFCRCFAWHSSEWVRASLCFWTLGPLSLNSQTSYESPIIISVITSSVLLPYFIVARYQVSATAGLIMLARPSQTNIQTPQNFLQNWKQRWYANLALPSFVSILLVLPPNIRLQKESKAIDWSKVFPQFCVTTLFALPPPNSALLNFDKLKPNPCSQYPCTICFFSTL